VNREVLEYVNGSAEDPEQGFAGVFMVRIYSIGSLF
jgi:hypothetical protein